jgi:2-polyprenyl-3-methyl-5-hydroxy-6-metoxy-1,4-benzoquinol methylase
MNDENEWHNQDEFWELFEPWLFNEQRQSDAKAEVENVVKLLKIEPKDRLLDLCCGIGRHSLELARRGFDVVGIDRTPAYIERAKQAAEKNDLKVDFVVGDMREYCVSDGYDIVINLFGSFGYFEDEEDDRKVVTNMYASLRPGGRLMIETMGKEILARELQARNWSEHEGTLILSERRPEQNWRRMKTRWIVIKGGQRIEHTVSVRSYSAVELTSLLKECSFNEVEVYGGTAGTEYNQEAKRLVVIGHRGSRRLTMRFEPTY